MKNLYGFLKTAIWCFIGVWIGTSSYQYYDYRANPWAYEMASAPWYTSIQVTGIFTAIVVVVLLLIMGVVKRKMR